MIIKFWNVGRSVALVCGGRFGVCLVIIQLHSDHAIEKGRGRDHWPRVYTAPVRSHWPHNPWPRSHYTAITGRNNPEQQETKWYCCVSITKPSSLLSNMTKTVWIFLFWSLAAVNCNQTTRSQPAPDLLRKWQKLQITQTKKSWGLHIKLGLMAQQCSRRTWLGAIMTLFKQWYTQMISNKNCRVPVS